MGPIGSPETSVLNHLTPRNNREDGSIQTFNQRLEGAWTVHLHGEVSWTDCAVQAVTKFRYPFTSQNGMISQKT